MTRSTRAARDSAIQQQQETWLGESWNTVCGITTHTASLTAVDGTVLTWENRSTRRISRPSVTSSITNLTCTDLGSNPRLCCGRPVTNRLSQSTADILTEKCNQNYWLIEYKAHDVMVTKCVIQDFLGQNASKIKVRNVLKLRDRDFLQRLTAVLLSLGSRINTHAYWRVTLNVGQLFTEAFK